MIFRHLLFRFVESWYSRRTNDGVGVLSAEFLRCLTTIPVPPHVPTPPAPEWPRCAVCGTIYSPSRGKRTCLDCERSSDPALCKRLGPRPGPRREATARVLQMRK